MNTGAATCKEPMAEPMAEPIAEQPATAVAPPPPPVQVGPVVHRHGRLPEPRRSASVSLASSVETVESEPATAAPDGAPLSFTQLVAVSAFQGQAWTSTDVMIRPLPTSTVVVTDLREAWARARRTLGPRLLRAAHLTSIAALVVARTTRRAARVSARAAHWAARVFARALVSVCVWIGMAGMSIGRAAVASARGVAARRIRIAGRIMGPGRQQRLRLRPLEPGDIASLEELRQSLAGRATSTDAMVATHEGKLVAVVAFDEGDDASTPRF